MLEEIINWLIGHGIKIAAILIAAVLADRVGKKFIGKAVKGGVKDGTEESTEKRQKTLIRIFSSALSVVVWLVAIMMVLPEFGIAVGPILAGAGILGVALGFGAQYMIRDFLAGLFVIIENQYRVGDVVCLDNTCGGVEDITLRKTVLRDLDGKVYHIPNGSFKMAANLTKGYSRAHMDISVAYKEDLDKVMALINKVGKEMAEESPWKEYILKPIQVLGPGPDSFGESGIIIKVLGETKPLKQWDTLKEFRKRLKRAFDREGIEIPFPQLSIWPRGNWAKQP
ncbi:MAG: mechanosensitive ion channel family protein [Candidatus Nealsonbacteria bacterium CG_4_8_14_3_um_filter_40_11]|uniref:Mechanosensitive ion channel family protein n=1 Tax=Candidatus Nealsonbacteria bacterium CG_4_8_14_3_um_filter_40_11 TaxID=1974690 RepID=A0A2M7IKL7_9BACT|nr:MAG: mechanosensitive ion channel family protein [Candidatus Nealsonbacteria bacterium CG_4_8_14_3_um_filter_40_11]